MKTYLIYSKSELSRQSNIERLQLLLPELELVEAFYPNKQKTPFLKKAMAVSLQRTGAALLAGEIGCLLSHRAIWRKIAASDIDAATHCLVLESDSRLNNPDLLVNFDKGLITPYDLFFWGAWDGHMQIFKNGRMSINEYQIGTPFLKSIYCTYGYSLNKQTAKFLLKRTGKFNYPVDQYKRFMQQNDLKIGGIVPELISTTGDASNIRTNRKWEWANQLYLRLLDFKNYLICYFK